MDASCSLCLWKLVVWLLLGSAGQGVRQDMRIGKGIAAGQGVRQDMRIGKGIATALVFRTGT